MHPYEILPFTNENLAKALSSKISDGRILERAHYRYLKNYLGHDDGIKAKTILIESAYISKAYITDYSNYYATCFQDYERKCKRLHFFDETFEDSKFLKELLDDGSSYLKDHYLGYIVVKPLPDSVIGPTILSTYSETQAEDQIRYFPATKKYEVNLFGKILAVNTLAYQEQDTVVSACASVAIWSAFHKTSPLFKTILPSPGEITKLAGNLFFTYGRTYPNQGLDLTQVCRAIDAVGLVSEVRSSLRFNTEINLASRIIYAYLKAEIPTLLLIKYDQKLSVGHAVTIAGYSKPKPKSEAPRAEITLTADRIDKFYVHDDQLGPFASYEFSGLTALKTFHFDNQGKKKYVSAWIHAVVIPLNSKIRIKFEDVFDTASSFDTIFYQLNFFRLELEWDIYLQESNRYKKELLKSGLEKDLVQTKITTNYPKYIWVARAKQKDHIIFDLLFDSTDIPSGNYCIDLVLFDDSVTDALLQIMKDYPDIFIDDNEGPKLGRAMYDKITFELSEGIKKLK